MMRINKEKEVIMKENYSKNGLNRNISEYENRIQVNKKNVRDRKAKGQFAVGMINELNKLENDLNNFHRKLRKKNRHAFL